MWDKIVRVNTFGVGMGFAGALYTYIAYSIAFIVGSGVCAVSAEGALMRWKCPYDVLYCALARQCCAFRCDSGTGGAVEMGVENKNKMLWVHTIA